MRHALLTVLLIGCVPGPGDAGGLPGDYSEFETHVQPILSEGCGSPSCHGTNERPLELYSVRMHRLDPDDVFLETPLTPEELWLNFARSCGFLMDLDAPEDCELLKKPLDPKAGGSEHVGGVQFGDADNPDYASILDWIGAERSYE